MSDPEYIGDAAIADRASLEVYQCECGYHFGVDSTFLEQVGTIETKCPSCKTINVVKGIE